MAVAEAQRGRGPVVFLDKDGTLIEDLPYNVDPSRIRFAPGAREAIRLLGEADAVLVIATNQSGVARGYFEEMELRAVEDHLAAEIAALGGRLAGFYYCPHIEPGEGVNDFARACDCRKPEPGMITRACTDLGLATDGAWFVGDAWMDVVAGKRAGCRTILVGPEARLADRLPVDRRPDHAVDNLLEAARIILEEPTPTSQPNRELVGSAE
jgi:D-glycero-D-manno-heptose 1,7-bisphosphate phosphatase